MCKKLGGRAGGGGNETKLKVGGVPEKGYKKKIRGEGVTSYW